MRCNARVTWFREPGHVQVDDVCVLENGHMEYEHLPSQKAAEQVSAREWNAALDAVTGAITKAVLEDETFQMDGPDPLLASVRRVLLELRR